MGEPLKTFFSGALVRRPAHDIARVHPSFPVRAFTNDACRGLNILLRSLRPEHATDESIGVGMAPFFYLPHTLFVAERGLDVAALRLLGYGQTPRVSVDAVTFTPRRVQIGGHVVMTFSLKSDSARRQHLLVDVAVHFVKARREGGAPRVIKMGRVVLAPGERAELKTRFSLAIHTTRIPRPGRHAVDVGVRG